MNLVKKVIYAPYGAFYWASALKLSVRSEFALALKALDKIKPLFEQNDAEYNLLRGYLEFATDHDQEAAKSFGLAVRLLNHSKRYSENEKNYLKCYAQGFIKHLEKYRNIKSGPHVADDVCRSIAIEGVASHLIRKYPLKRISE